MSARTVHKGRYLAGGVLLAAMATTLATRILAADPPRVFITEVHSAGNTNTTYKADWFEITNMGTSAVDITGWKVDDDSNSFDNALALRGITSLPPGKSAVFIEGSADGMADAGVIASFITAWFGSTPPAGFLIGSYGGSAIGFGGGGDAVNLFDASGARAAGVRFGASPAALATFDNSTGIGGVTLPLPLISAPSTVGFNGVFASLTGGEKGSPGIREISSPLTSIDLSTYVRTHRYSLPSPSTVVPPPNSELAAEASAVTYDRDTDSLFLLGDEGTSIVQVTKTGQLIDSMTLGVGEFADTEGLTYVGNNMFVMVEERVRQAVLFTYAPGATLTRSNTKTVKLGTTVGNIGLEGISADPQTSGFIFVKENGPQGIFQSGLDFNTGTATNGSPTTDNSTNLFDPALLNLLDLTDVYALSNLKSLTGADSTHLLVLSQEAGRIVNVDRQGNVSSALTIVADPGSSLSVPDQGHEGLTMDGNGILYVVAENGGGAGFPELWVYEKSLTPNQPATAIALTSPVNSILENTSTAARVKVAGISISDDGLGSNTLTVSGPDAAFFEVDSNGLYIKAATVLDFETKSSYSVAVNVDDASVGGTPDATAPYNLTLLDVVEEGTPPTAAVVISEVAPWGSGDAPYGADWFEVKNTGNSPVIVTGWKMDDNTNAFGSAVALNGITTIAAGETVVFMETSTPDVTKAAFLSAWFGANPPAALQVGSYTGGGIGLSTDGDAVNLFDASGSRVAGIRFGASTTGVTFDNTAGLGSTTLPLPLVTTLSVAGTNNAFAAADGVETGSPGGIVPVLPPPSVVISEVAPWGSGNTPYGADWFEVTNTGTVPVTVAGWKMDDNSNASGSAVALTGVNTIAPGEAVIFMETATPATTRAAFLPAWYGATPPVALQVGSYTGGGVGLSGDGDAVNLFDANGNRITGVRFGASTAGVSFDNSAGVGSTTLPLPLISTLSAAGVNNAFMAADGAETGSPGGIAPTVTPPSVIVSEVTPWSSGNSPYAADWFEVTNIGTKTVFVTGWKMDDNSNAFGSSVPMNGITSIAPGESVVFMETSSLASAKAAFLSTWFGTHAPAGLQVGAYSGGGVGLSTDGDAVNLFDAFGARVTGVRVGASTSGRTFDNAEGAGSTILPLPLVSALSVEGANGAFLSSNGAEAGSPGSVATAAGNVTATRGGFVLDRRTGMFLQQVTVTNTSGVTANGPIVLVLDNLSTNANLANLNGTTAAFPFAPLGSPYVVFPGSAAGLAPGGSLTVTLQFNNPTRAAISYSPRVLNGVAAP